MADDGERELERAYEDLERELPDRAARAIRWMRDPRARRFRIPLGVLCLLGGLLWFLPVLGLWLLPLGLLLIAQDVPFLRKPVARATSWLAARWRALRHRWQERRARRESGGRLAPPIAPRDPARSGAHGGGAP